MRKVVTISLNGRAIQVDEDGYRALKDYLQDANTRLAGNPDAAEILSDIEQAIADKCQARLAAHRDVVPAEEVAAILDEMGPVEVDNRATGAGEPDGATGPDADPPASRRRKLFRLKEGAKLGGVCNGLAAYTGIDVTWVRLGFLLLAFSTGVFFFVWLAMLFLVPVAVTEEDLALAGVGNPTLRNSLSRPLFRIPSQGMAGGVCAGFAAWFGVDVIWVRLVFLLLSFITLVFAMVWLALLVVMPAARTPEEIAAVQGEPFNARDILDRNRRRPPRSDGSRPRAAASAAATPASTPSRVAAATLMPVLTLLSATLFVAFLVALGLLASHLGVGDWSQWQMPHGMQGWSFELHHGRWAPVIVLVVVYFLIALPLGMARRGARRHAQGGNRHGLATGLDRLLWIGLVLLLAWAIWNEAPWVVDRLRELIEGHGPAQQSVTL
ncbi:MAG: Phage shock protein [Pseudomonadota bacterium]|jgi:phage shock protein PspC (stress-responsive transcriptional regulator)